MEINITRFFNEACPSDYSASAMELGQNVGQITWRAAMHDALEYMHLDSDEKREAMRQHVKGFGAWNDEEIADWSAKELEALFIQMVSGDMRDADLSGIDTDWEAYEEGAQAGRFSSRIGRGDNGQVYYYLGD